MTASRSQSAGADLWSKKVVAVVVLVAAGAVPDQLLRGVPADEGRLQGERGDRERPAAAGGVLGLRHRAGLRGGGVRGRGGLQPDRLLDRPGRGLQLDDGPAGQHGDAAAHRGRARGRADRVEGGQDLQELRFVRASATVCNVYDSRGVLVGKAMRTPSGELRLTDAQDRTVTLISADQVAQVLAERAAARQ